MPSFLKRNWRRLLLLAAMALFIGIIYQNRQELVRVKSVLARGSYQYFLMGLAAQMGFYFLQAIMYQRILTIWFPVPLGTAYRLTLSSNSLNKLVPSGGVSGLMIFTGQAQGEGVNPGVSLLSNIWFYILDYSSFLLVVWWSILYFIHVRGLGAGPRLAGLAFTIIVLALAAIILLALSHAERFASWLSSFYRRGPSRVQDMKLWLINMLREISSIQKMIPAKKSSLFLAFLAGLAMQLTDAGIIYLCFATLHYQVGLAVIIAGFGLASAMSMVSMVPQGIGIYETSMTWVYMQLGIPFSVAVTVALLYRGITFWFAIVPGLFTMRKEGQSF